MKRLFAFIIAVTLFFSFAVPSLAAVDVPVGVSDVSSIASSPVLMAAETPSVMAIEPDTPSANGSWLDGTVSFLDGKASVSNGSTSTFFSSLRSFTVPANNGKTISFNAQHLPRILSGNSPYLLSFDAVVPAEPVSVSIVLTGPGDKGWVTVPVPDFSYSGGRLCIDSLFKSPKDGYFRHLTLSYSDNFSSSFDVTVSSFSVTNLSTMSFENISSAKSASTYDIYDSSGSSIGSDVSMGSSVAVSRSTLNGGWSVGHFRLIPRTDTSISYPSLPDLFYFKAVITTDVNLDLSVYSVKFAGKNVSFDYHVVPHGLVVTGIFDVSQFSGSPTFYMSWYGEGNLAPADIVFRSFDYCRVDDLFASPEIVSGDSGFAAWIGSFFSNMYNSLIGFFISQDDDTEKDFDDSYNSGVDDAVSEAQSNMASVEEFEHGIFDQAGSAMQQVNPGGVETPSTLINSMAFISGLWTNSFNSLPSDFQFVITFPLFLGLSLMFIGRAGRVFGGSISRRPKSSSGNGSD